MKCKFLNRLLAFVLTVLILFVSVGNAFISVNDISVTHAVGPLVLGYDVMYEICRYFGSVFYGYSAARELPEVNFHDDDMAKLGHDLLLAMYGHDGIFYPFPDPDPTITDPEYWEAYDDAYMAYYFPQFVNGQSYVFGAEALKETAETDFRLIQGGRDVHNNNDDDDDNNDDNNNDDDNVIHFPKRVGDAVEGFVAFTVTGAAAIAKAISDQYQKWVNGDPDSILAEFLANMNDTFSDYESIQNLDGSYNISGFSHYSNFGNYDTYIFSDSLLFRPFCVTVDNDYGIGINFFHYKNGDVSIQSVHYERYRDGKLVHSSSSTGFGANKGFGLNIPIFSSLDAAKSAFESDDFSSALNYAKTYQVADWLQDDWSGELLDPLTGLNALSNWYNIARHQGLNALGSNPSVEDLLNYLRDYFAQLDTGRLPEVDPSLAPIKYPAYVEDVVIDPAANPSVYPASGKNPGTSPGTGTDPGTDTDPGGGTDTDVDMDENDYKVDLRGIFPFCIPFDFVALLNVLDADPVAPRFDFPVVIPALNYQDSVVLDMSMFDDVAKVIRICEKVSFVIFLMFATSKVIRW